MLRELDFAAMDAARLNGAETTRRVGEGVSFRAPPMNASPKVRGAQMHPRFYCAHVAIFYERQAVASDCPRAWVAADRWHRLDKEGLRLPARS